MAGSVQQSVSNVNCCVFGCHSKKSKQPDVHFHCFPRKNSEIVKICNMFGGTETVDRRKAWIVKLKMGKPVTKHMRVCSLHFTEEDYLAKGVKLVAPKLKRTAVPSSNLPSVGASLSTTKQQRRRGSKKIDTALDVIHLRDEDAEVEMETDVQDGSDIDDEIENLLSTNEASKQVHLNVEIMKSLPSSARLNFPRISCGTSVKPLVWRHRPKTSTSSATNSKAPRTMSSTNFKSKQMTIRFEIDNISDEEKKKVFNILPLDYETLVTDYGNINNGFFVNLRTSLCTKDDALAWKSQFEEKSSTTYLTDSMYKENTQKTVFKRVYHCLHNTRPRKNVQVPHYKHTACQAKLTINVKQRKMKRSRDIHLKSLPCVISIRHNHNHCTKSPFALRHKRPTPSLKEKFQELFARGLSPSAALKCFKRELREKYGEDYSKIVADGSKCPTLNWCYLLYYKVNKKEYIRPGEYEILEVDNNFGKNSKAENDEMVAITTNSSREIVTAEENLRQALNTIFDKFCANPSVYVDAANKFHAVVQGAKTDAVIVSALRTFGNRSLVPRKRKFIQPSAAVRRKLSRRDNKNVETVTFIVEN